MAEPLPLRLHQLTRPAGLLQEPTTAEPTPIGPLNEPDVRARCAAAYLRVSTSQQEYSLPVQRAAIARRAHQLDLFVVRTYADDGRSGLSIEGRPGMLGLIQEVAGGLAPYRTVLVYDVSRWGRFQDCDEAAFYEFLCRKMGIQVVYCAEPFSGMPAATADLYKVLKRVMAAEYSRELSVKAAAAHRRISLLGFRQGGPVALGYRRVILGPKGEPLATLERGEHKNSPRLRITLTPGPLREQRLVRGIFRAMASGGSTPVQIAQRLNLRGPEAACGRVWDGDAVRRVLRSETYAGDLLYGKTTRRLPDMERRPAPERLVRVRDAHPALVSRELQQRAASALARLDRRPSDGEVLDSLRGVLARHGRISAKLLREDPQAMSPRRYRHRFGGLMQAYRLIGYTPLRSSAFLVNRSRRLAEARSLRQEVAAGLRGLGVNVRPLAAPDLLVGRLRVAVVLANPLAGRPRWATHVLGGRPRPWLLAACPGPAGSAAVYFLIRSGGCLEFGEAGPARRASTRWESLRPLLEHLAAIARR